MLSSVNGIWMATTCPEREIETWNGLIAGMYKTEVYSSSVVATIGGSMYLGTSI